MSVEDLLRGLDDEQTRAVSLEHNGVVSAGAGSGKTRVLASRYVWLVIEKNLAPEEIITLTFTNKAVSEMYSRIYRYLMEQADPGDGAAGTGCQRAAKAIANFHKARISTLDAFSASIARSAAARYGISPDFKSDNAALKELVRDAALAFVLNHREDPAVRALLGDHKIKNLAEEILSQLVLKHSPVSSPLDMDTFLSIQKEEITRAWREKGRQAEHTTSDIIDALRDTAGLNDKTEFMEFLENNLLKKNCPSLPDILPLLKNGGTAGADPDDESPQAEARKQIKEYFDFYHTLFSQKTPGRYKQVYARTVENYRQLKGADRDGLCYELESIANYACNFGLCAGVFELIKQFQDEFNRKKRQTGFLSFNDIARLAVDALKDHPDIRSAYKENIRMIMIDEFQDNNALQRDLIYLLAENTGRNEKGIARSGEMGKNRMFFVGDEKQSIYRFRGADVAVFRSLSRTLNSPDSLSPGKNINLNHNYRSRPALIAAFNHIFGRVFLPPGPEVPDYEAAYNPINAPENNKGKDDAPGDQGPLAHFCFLNSEELPEENTEGIRSQDLEAVYIAGKIRKMVMNREEIPKRKDGKISWVPCNWGDFAVLERKYTHQDALEKHFREFGIPYNTDRPSGLFNDAPILDLRAFLRLIVYPEDRLSYAALIRSPFMRLSDESLAVCMLGPNMSSGNTEPFTEENDDLIPEDDRELYQMAREKYRYLREASRSLSITELITKLWYEEGYRYETLWTESAQVYENLFDLFFSLASDAEERGKNLAEFIEYLDDVMNREEKPDDKDIPGEGESGVRILTIHKSKGLEFPVVFIFDCTHSDNRGGTAKLVSYHDSFGPILNIPQAEELQTGGNYFRDIFDKEENEKDTAELRRLLYVAMTRAEARLYLTFTLRAQTKKEKESWDMESQEFNDEAIRLRLAQLEEKTEKRKTFLTLLAPVLPDCPASLCSLEVIPVLSRSEIQEQAGSVQKSCAEGSKTAGMTQREAALWAAPFYESSELIQEGKTGPEYLQASKLIFKTTPGLPLPSPVIPEDSIYEKAGISPAEFGSLVHAVLEAQLTGRPCLIPSKIRSRLDEDKILQDLMALAESMAKGFLASDLGKRLAASACRESEFPIITSAEIEGKTIVIMGQIDLLFEEDDSVMVVDFKTDRIENPEEHYGQLAAYYRAAGDIFCKPVSAWLFYLQSGRAVEVTEEVKNLSFDELISAK